MWSEREIGDKQTEREKDYKQAENKSHKTNKGMGDTVLKTWKEEEEI